MKLFFQLITSYTKMDEYLHSRIFPDTFYATISFRSSILATLFAWRRIPAESVITSTFATLSISPDSIAFEFDHDVFRLHLKNPMDSKLAHLDGYKKYIPESVREIIARESIRYISSNETCILIFRLMSKIGYSLKLGDLPGINCKKIIVKNIPELMKNVPNSVSFNIADTATLSWHTLCEMYGESMFLDEKKYQRSLDTIFGMRVDKSVVKKIIADTIVAGFKSSQDGWIRTNSMQYVSFRYISVAYNFLYTTGRTADISKAEFLDVIRPYVSGDELEYFGNIPNW